MNLHTQHILLVGAGNMGGALLHAWAESDIPKDHITIVEKHPEAHEALFREGWSIINSADNVTTMPDVIILAVKPQSMEAVLPPLAKKFGTKPLYVSIAAGKTLSYFAIHLGNAPIVRAMPNTPALIRKGISALCANAQTNDVQKKLATALLEAAGEVVWLEDESQMDVVTAISGSGPAYVFLFMEALAQAGMAYGLPETLSRKLAEQTVSGSAVLSQHNDRVALTELRQNVTSKGGTTEAALNILMHNDALKKLLANAVDAAITRSKELA